MPRPQPQEVQTKTLIASWSPGHKIVGARALFAGLFLDTGVDQNLDAAATAVGWTRAKLGHGDGAVREHWLLPSPFAAFVLIGGVPFRSIGALAEHPGECQEYLIGCRWPHGERSALQIHFLFSDLLEPGYETPIPFVVRSKNTDDVLAALLAHDAMLSYVEERAQAAGRPRSFEFYEIAALFRAGDDTPRGSRTNPEAVATVQPPEYAHRAEPTGAYVREYMAPESVERIFRERYDEMRRATVNFIERVERARQPGQVSR